MLTYISWILTLTLTLSLTPALLVVIVLKKPLKMIQKVIQNKKAKFSSIAEEGFSSIRTVKSFATERFETSKFMAANQSVYDESMRRAYYQALYLSLFNLFLFMSLCTIIYHASDLY